MTWAALLFLALAAGAGGATSIVLVLARHERRIALIETQREIDRLAAECEASRLAWPKLPR